MTSKLSPNQIRAMAEMYAETHGLEIDPLWEISNSKVAMIDKERNKTRFIDFGDLNIIMGAVERYCDKQLSEDERIEFVHSYSAKSKQYSVETWGEDFDDGSWAQQGSVIINESLPIALVEALIEAKEN